MTVTQLETAGRGKYAVSIDGEFAFLLYSGEIRRYAIEEGCELKQDVWQDIMEHILPKRAKLRCMNLLKTRSYTRQQLADKLAMGRYPEAVIEEALAYVESFGYVNDKNYAVSYVEDHMESRSLKRMEEDLRRKGISRQVISEALAQVQERDGKQDEVGMILQLLERKHYDPEQADFNEKRKIQAFLCRRGFTPEGIRRAMKAAQLDDGFDWME